MILIKQIKNKKLSKVVILGVKKMKNSKTILNNYDEYR